MVNCSVSAVLVVIFEHSLLVSYNLQMVQVMPFVLVQLGAKIPQNVCLSLALTK